MEEGIGPHAGDLVRTDLLLHTFPNMTDAKRLCKVMERDQREAACMTIRTIVGCNDNAEAALQYLTWALEETERNGCHEAAGHVRSALEALRRDSAHLGNQLANRPKLGDCA
jgi:hypothetical protein